MTTSITAVFEGGVFRPVTPLNLTEGTRVELIVCSDEQKSVDGREAAKILAEIAALSTSSGDPNTSRNHDQILYGDEAGR